MSPEVYETALNIFCEFSARSLEEAKKNFESITLPERKHGDKVEYDKELYILCLYNYTALHDVRKTEENKNKLLETLAETTKLLKNAQDVQDGKITENGEKTQYTFLEKELLMLNAIREEIGDFLLQYTLQKEMQKELSAKGRETRSPDI